MGSTSEEVFTCEDAAMDLYEAAVGVSGAFTGNYLSLTPEQREALDVLDTEIGRFLLGEGP